MGILARLLKPAAQWFKLESKRGVSAIEYGLLAALIALVIISAVTTLGKNLRGVYQSISSQVHS